ncbi:MAG: molybdopterin-guanine dinucleotide biosynthesis protein B [Planctomycetaceae bacterium]|jgi:molybdopterin-guanine dinucleotide biosynthesis adapter protein|nr:molybdopterin-guanine dinucleotide biosynthesis protein B [Planctomycetaceae bacterium]MBT6483487.1 molybdopterin-guanine dinucleotide biosynthesis protein B [Planctomycetaceae bacterium]MBT6494702.1 molybdopterin-guanine dinucleotide biosynthesis protein B [Planctomycetaceae bacterium]
MFSKNFDRVLKALTYLAERDPASCKTVEIANAAGCSPTSLTKDLQALSRAGIVKTRRGARGGICLLRKPAQLSISEIAAAVSPPKRFTSPPYDGPIVPGHDCPLQRRLAHVEALSARVLNETTLAEFVTEAAGSTAGQFHCLDDLLQQVGSRCAIPPRLHVVGRKNSGKTTLVVDLVEQLSRGGLRVGTIKHTHHHHELDTPGKDSFRHRQAGAAVVGILSPAMDAVFLPQTRAEECAARYSNMMPLFAECDLVLVEGDQQTDGRKIEVWRDEVSEKPLAMSDESILAIVTDDEVPATKSTPLWSRADIAQLSAEVLKAATVAPGGS